VTPLIQAYYRLTKPGIIYGNALNATAGFLLASVGATRFDLWLLVATITGISLIIASACVYNNYIDRGIDIKMARTKKRALVTGQIPARNAIVYATVLGLAGFGVLSAYTNTKVLLLGILAMFTYVVVYGIAKRRTVHGTIVGSISGSLPPVAGYIAVTNNFDAGALILFLILTFWQMPHFFAIAMYRHSDYAAAAIPVWPVKRGMHSTKVQIMLYVTGFIAANAALTVYGYTGYFYLGIMTAVGLAWLWRGLQGFKASDDVRWARKMFFFSLVVIVIQCLMLPIGALLP
jgi:protoheme IX farnesyltransferase